MKIENRTELKEYRIECQKNNRLTAEYWFAGNRMSGKWIRQDL